VKELEMSQYFFFTLSLFHFFTFVLQIALKWLKYLPEYQRIEKMAVPKKKTSAARSKQRRAHDALPVMPASTCKKCGEKKRPHHVCAACGSK